MVQQQPESDLVCKILQVFFKDPVLSSVIACCSLISLIFTLFLLAPLFTLLSVCTADPNPRFGSGTLIPITLSSWLSILCIVHRKGLHSLSPWYLFAQHLPNPADSVCPHQPVESLSCFCHKAKCKAFCSNLNLQFT